MISVLNVCWLLFIHWIGDFRLQSDEMVKGKSTSIFWLGVHCVVYGFILFVGTFNPMLAVVNMLCHFLIDLVTSKINKWLWDEGRVHDFFECIGFDQFLHLTILIWTYTIFVN